MKKIMRWLNLQKEGIIVGTVIAGFVYWKNIEIPLLNITQTGFQKLAILVLLFSTIGALIDSVYKPNK